MTANVLPGAGKLRQALSPRWDTLPVDVAAISGSLVRHDTIHSMFAQSRAFGQARRSVARTAIIAGLVWMSASFLHACILLPTPSPLAPSYYSTLTSGVVASMNSPAFVYSPHWNVSALGADPSEPDLPWDEPAGTLEFEYIGQRLDLLLALGDYWGYLYITVDGRPANRLASIPGNRNSLQEQAGYRTLYAPELQTKSGPEEQWITVHWAESDPRPHQVYVEVWRSWDQRPLRAVAIDPHSPNTWPYWPGLLLLLVGILGEAHLRLGAKTFAFPTMPQTVARRLLPPLSFSVAVALATVAAIIIAYAILWDNWWLVWAGLAGLAYLAVMRPSLWAAVFLFGLPFYYSVNLPILPNRDFGIVDIGAAGAICILLANQLLAPERVNLEPAQSRGPGLTYVARWLPWSLAILCSWALVSTIAARYTSQALYEWRTVFLYAFIFSLLLQIALTCATPSRRVNERELWLVLAGWQLGATAMALIGLWHYLSGSMLISAEGVSRIRAMYGSPNNLALYLERSVAVALGCALFLPRSSGWRWGWTGLAIVQVICLLFTFSKGSILLGVPAILATLAVTGFFVLRGRRATGRLFVWLAISALLIVLGLVPFLGTERFRRLLDLSQGTGYLRLQLWRSSLQMALDHPWLGVGPDNFLYTFRSIYLLPDAWQEPDLNHPHNWILDWWTRLGLPGLVIGTYILLRGISSIIRHIAYNATSAPALTAMHIGVLAAIAGALAHGLIDASYALPDLMITWVLLLGLTVRARSGQSPPPV